jgi:hypothetical protein
MFDNEEVYVTGIRLYEEGVIENVFTLEVTVRTLFSG